MSDQFIEQEYRAPQSLFDLLPRIEKPIPNRKQFIDESFLKVNELRGKYPKTEVGRIGMMVGVICPKNASEAFIHDIHKECQIAKNYRVRFWQFYNEAKKGVV